MTLDPKAWAISMAEVIRLTINAADKGPWLENSLTSDYTRIFHAGYDEGFSFALKEMGYAPPKGKPK